MNASWGTARPWSAWPNTWRESVPTAKHGWPLHASAATSMWPVPPTMPTMAAAVAGS
ncbi:hypothetical protein JKG47_16840 [Acidithiobacillus sp. MC6.1]|nr:hypothetical protein [Acidithiobacillus sp. MC6.1]